MYDSVNGMYINYTHLSGVDTNHASFSCSPGIPFLQARFSSIHWGKQQIFDTVCLIIQKDRLQMVSASIEG